MEFLQLGLEAMKIVRDVKINSELAEANRERDMYKMKAENLSWQLNELKKEKKTTGNEKRSGFPRGHNSKPSSQNHHGERNRYNENPCSQDHHGGRNRYNDKPGSQNSYNARRTFEGNRGNGQCPVNQQHRSNIYNNYNTSMGFNANNWKPKSKGSNFGMNRGRGSFQKSGRGRGGGSTDQ